MNAFNLSNVLKNSIFYLQLVYYHWYLHNAHSQCAQHPTEGSVKGGECGVIQDGAQTRAMVLPKGALRRNVKANASRCVVYIGTWLISKAVHLALPPCAVCASNRTSSAQTKCMCTHPINEMPW